MAGTIEPESAAAAGPADGMRSASGSRFPRPAAAAAERVWAAGMVLWASGLALSVFVIGRLLLTWRVTPHAASHQISLLVQRLSYPVANVDALIVLALALAGLAVGAMTAWGGLRGLGGRRDDGLGSTPRACRDENLRAAHRRAEAQAVEGRVGDRRRASTGVL